MGPSEGMEGPDAAGFLRANLSKWDSFLEGPVTLRLIGRIALYGRREGLRSAAHSHLPCTERA